MATLKYIAGVDLMTVTLDSAYTAGSGAMALTAGHGARLPSAGDFWLRTTTGTYRCFKVTARSTDTLTVTAAQDGTSDGNLDSGAELKWVLGATAFDQFRSERMRVMTVAEFDALGSGDYKNGDRILLSDGPYEVLRVGDAWQYLFQGRRVTRPPSADWTFDNQDSTTVDSTKGFEYTSTPKSGAARVTVRHRTAPATPYTVKFLLDSDFSGIPPGVSGGTGNAGAGVALRESATGKILDFRIGQVSSAWAVQLLKWTDFDSASTAYTNYTHSAAGIQSVNTRPKWYAISNTGTNLVFYWSMDGLHWKQFESRAIDDFFTTGPDQYGVLVYANGNAVETALLSMEVQASATPF